MAESSAFQHDCLFVYTTTKNNWHVAPTKLQDLMLVAAPKMTKCLADKAQPGRVCSCHWRTDGMHKQTISAPWIHGC